MGELRYFEASRTMGVGTVVALVGESEVEIAEGTGMVCVA